MALDRLFLHLIKCLHIDDGIFMHRNVHWMDATCWSTHPHRCMRQGIRPAPANHATMTTWMRSWASSSNEEQEAQGDAAEVENQAAAPEGSGAQEGDAEQAAPLDPRDEELAKHKEEVRAVGTS